MAGDPAKLKDQEALAALVTGRIKARHDAATKALMLRFYAKWQPKDTSPAMTAAEALRDAQAFVRAQPRWAHPRDGVARLLRHAQ